MKLLNPVKTLNSFHLRCTQTFHLWYVEFKVNKQKMLLCMCGYAWSLCKYFKGVYVVFVSQITPFKMKESTHN